jgi:predicted TIM-barrel enzyme
MKKIIGMIHLSGAYGIKISRALEEIEIYKNNNLYGCIIENYFSSESDVEEVLKNIKNIDIKIGINILPNNYEKAFYLSSKYKVDFIQLDYISGIYKKNNKTNIELDIDKYSEFRSYNKNIEIFGGVWPKYYTPIDNSNLNDDINSALNLCDSIVVTGNATGVETSLDKIKLFKNIIANKKPLIIGAGVNHTNINQLSHVDGAIIGSAFKNNINDKIDESLVKSFMSLL